MTQPAVTIIIPVYNVEPYVEECLKSVMSQTCSEPMECIIVDDCGTDQSMTIARRMVADYDGPIQFTILRHDYNRGLSAARNTGIKHATGQYLMFIDSDDSVHPDFCKDAYECAIQHHADLVMFGNQYIENEDKKKITEHRFSKEGYKIQRELMDILFESNGIAAWNKLYRADLFDGISYPEGFNYEDEGTTYKLVIKASCIYYLDKVLYYYYSRPASITKQINEKAFDQRARINLQRYHDLKAWGYQPEHMEYRIRTFAFNYMIRKRRDMSNPDYVLLSQLLQDTTHLPPAFSFKQKLLVYIFKYTPWLFESYFTLKGRKL